MPSEGFQIKIAKDSMTPAMRKALGLAKHPEAVLRAAGTQVVSIAKRSFREPGLRGVPWPAKLDGTASNLIDKGVLSKSIRITELTADSVKVGSDRKYAAIHQLGGVIKAKPGKGLVFQSGGKTFRVKKVVMPARPYLPFDKDGKLIPVAQKKVRLIIQAAVDMQLGVGES